MARSLKDEKQAQTPLGRFFGRLSNEEAFARTQSLPQPEPTQTLTDTRQTLEDSFARTQYLPAQKPAQKIVDNRKFLTERRTRIAGSRSVPN